MQSRTFSQRLVAEFIGTAALLAAIVGSGIMAERLSAGNVAITLLANSIAIGSALLSLILIFGPISGAHFNPAVSLSGAMLDELRKPEAALYALAQLAGALLGVMVANLMFDLPALATSTKVRAGFGVLFGEVVATFGLIGVVTTVGRRGNVGHTAAAVAAYILAGCWFTSSTSFANPAVTIARILSDTFTGIRPIDAPAFVIAQIVGAVTGTMVFKWLDRRES